MRIDTAANNTLDTKLKVKCQMNIHWTQLKLQREKNQNWKPV